MNKENKQYILKKFPNSSAMAMIEAFQRLIIEKSVGFGGRKKENAIIISGELVDILEVWKESFKRV